MAQATGIELVGTSSGNFMGSHMAWVLAFRLDPPNGFGFSFGFPLNPTKTGGPLRLLTSHPYVSSHHVILAVW